MNKHGYSTKFGYNADAHSKLGLDGSATRKEMQPIRDENYVEPEHMILRNVQASMLQEDYQNYLGSTVYKIPMKDDSVADKYLSVVDELECDMIENENGTYDIDLGPSENAIFRVCIDENGDGRYNHKFMNAGELVSDYEKAYGVSAEATDEKPKMVVHGRSRDGQEFDYLSQEQPDGSFETEPYER